jgi:hypothetical protein
MIRRTGPGVLDTGTKKKKNLTQRRKGAKLDQSNFMDLNALQGYRAAGFRPTLKLVVRSLTESGCRASTPVLRSSLNRPV